MGRRKESNKQICVRGSSPAMHGWERRYGHGGNMGSTTSRALGAGAAASPGRVSGRLLRGNKSPDPHAKRGRNGAKTTLLKAASSSSHAAFVSGAPSGCVLVFAECVVSFAGKKKICAWNRSTNVCCHPIF